VIAEVAAPGAVDPGANRHARPHIAKPLVPLLERSLLVARNQDFRLALGHGILYSKVNRASSGEQVSAALLDTLISNRSINDFLEGYPNV
jgi:hypothetical protein